MNNYKQVIKELRNLNELEYKSIIYKIAEISPSTLCKAINCIKIECDSVRPKIIKLHQNGGTKVDAIKLCRELTGSGLKESKDYVESIINW